MRPLFGAASTSQAMAPRKGGVTNEAVISARTMRRAGMSERATSQAIGAAISVERQPTQVATVRLIRSGASSVGSLNSCLKLASDGAPVFVGERRDGKPEQRQPDKHQQNERADREQDAARVETAEQAAISRARQSRAAGRQDFRRHVPKYFV